METITATITWDDNFGTYCDLLPGCVATHVNLEGVKKAFEDAVNRHLEGMREDKEEIPTQFQAALSFHYSLNTRALLKAMDEK
jgi:predicted RNase H-like HicB family nuclease